MILDFSLPNLRGDKIYKKTRKICLDGPVIMISSKEQISTAISLHKTRVNASLIKDEATKIYYGVAF